MAPPKPPPGFELDAPAGPVATPAPPPGFELDAPAVAPREVPGGEVALRGFAQGASMGFSDELSGVWGDGVRRVTEAGLGLAKTGPGRAAVRRYLGGPWDAVPDAVVDALIDHAGDVGSYEVLGTRRLKDASYSRFRDEARRDDIAAQKDSPWLYGGSSLAGAFMGPGPKGAKGQQGLAKAATLAKQGAAFGSASGLGSSDADLTDFDASQLLDAGLSTVGGGVVGAILAPVMGVAGDKLRPALTRLAENNALKAIGVRAGISDQLGKRGYESADEARGLGRAALDMGLVRPFRTASDVAERAGFAKEVQGARIEQVLADAEQGAATANAAIRARNEAALSAARANGQGAPVWPEAEKPPFDMREASMRAALGVAGPEGLTTEALSKSGPAQSIVERIAAQGEVNPTFRAANRLKSDIYEGINYGTEPALSTKLQRRAASGLRGSIEEQVERNAGADAADELRAANRAYGYLQDISPLASEEATRQLARAPWYSPGSLAASLLAGGAGIQAAGAKGASVGVLPLAAKALGPRIPSALAVGANSAAQYAPRLGMAAAPAIQAPLKPSLEQREQDAISEFLSSMP